MQAAQCIDILFDKDGYTFPYDNSQYKPRAIWRLKLGCGRDQFLASDKPPPLANTLPTIKLERKFFLFLEPRYTEN